MSLDEMAVLDVLLNCGSRKKNLEFPCILNKNEILPNTGFETQRRRHQKSKTEALQKGLVWPPKIRKIILSNTGYKT